MNLSFRRGSLVGALAVALLVALPAAAWAHGDVESSDPAVGSTIKKPVDTITITFTEAPLENARIRVFDGCKEEIVDLIHVVERTMHVLLTHKGEPGKWKVTYKVVSAEDGHESEGSYGFTVKGKRDCSDDEGGDGASSNGTDDDDGVAAPDEPTSDEGSDLPMVALLVGALALIGIAVLAKVAGARK